MAGFITSKGTRIMVARLRWPGTRWTAAGSVDLVTGEVERARAGDTIQEVHEKFVIRRGSYETHYRESEAAALELARKFAGKGGRELRPEELRPGKGDAVSEQAKRGRGRPKGSGLAEDPRTVIRPQRWTPSEWEGIQAAAAREGLKPSEFIRRAALARVLIPKE